MSQFIFQTVPLVEASLFQKLLKQHPQENAVIELNNLLATKPICQLSPGDIAAIEIRYGLSLKREFGLNLEEFYATYLNYCLADKSLSTDELDDLKQLKDLLALDDQTVDKLHAELGQVVYKKSFEEAVADGRLTQEEKAFLNTLEAELKLPKQLAEQISKDVRSAHLQAYATAITCDQRISPAEENELRAIAASLQVEVQMDKANQQQFQKMKLYWALENLPLPVITPDIALQKAEQCYLQLANVNWFEPRVARQSGVVRLATFKVAKEFYTHSGSQVPRDYSTEHLKLIDTGAVYLTNKRILFAGRGKNYNIGLSKILNFTPFVNGVEIGKDAGRNPVLEMVSQADIFCMILERLLRGN